MSAYRTTLVAMVVAWLRLFRPEYWQWPVDEICRRAYTSTAAVAERFLPGEG